MVGCPAFTAYRTCFEIVRRVSPCVFAARMTIVLLSQRARIMFSSLSTLIAQSLRLARPMHRILLDYLFSPACVVALIHTGIRDPVFTLTRYPGSLLDEDEWLNWKDILLVHVPLSPLLYTSVLTLVDVCYDLCAAGGLALTFSLANTSLALRFLNCPQWSTSWLFLDFGFLRFPSSLLIP
jgi:hypothetical protein